jgi:Zn-dependent metalloprotease
MFQENQEFIGIYPPECAIWCTQNGFKIVEAGSRGAKTVYKIVKITRSKDELISQIRDLYKKLQKEDSNAVITVNGHKINANDISLRRVNVLIKNFEKNSQMGKMVFVTADNESVLVEKEDLEKFRDAIEDFSVFLPQRKSEILKSIDGLSDDEVQTFDVSKVFDYEV